MECLRSFVTEAKFEDNSLYILSPNLCLIIHTFFIELGYQNDVR